MTHTSALLSFAILAALALPACSSSHSGDDAGNVPDGLVPIDGSLRPDVPSMGCGGATCESGEICCSGCPGDPPLGCFEGGCPPIACPAVWLSCDDALIAGTNGDRCEFDEGCSVNEGCCSSFASCADGILRVEQDCAPGCFACASNEDCDADAFCDFGSLGCGGPGTCLPRPTACDADCPGVCSCDGDTFCNACGANAEGASVARDGACDETGCGAQDARGSGACALFLGYRWDGASCTGIGGCSCVGVDCDALYESPEMCERAHAECTGSPCDALDAEGDGLCDGFFGYSWDGAGCVGISGCSCVGTNCDRLYDSPAACTAAHSGCGPEEACVAQSARGEGDCRLLLGYLWNGNMCLAIGGCACVGDDCDALYDERSACERAHEDCIVPF